MTQNVNLSMNIPIWRGKVNSEINQQQNDLLSRASSRPCFKISNFKSKRLYRERRFKRKIKLYQDKLFLFHAYKVSKKGHSSNQVSFQSVRF